MHVYLVLSQSLDLFNRSFYDAICQWGNLINLSMELFGVNLRLEWWTLWLPRCLIKKHLHTCKTYEYGIYTESQGFVNVRPKVLESTPQILILLLKYVINGRGFFICEVTVKPSSQPPWKYCVYVTSNTAPAPGMRSMVLCFLTMLCNTTMEAGRMPGYLSLACICPDLVSAVSFKLMFTMHLHSKQ